MPPSQGTIPDKNRAATEEELISSKEHQPPIQRQVWIPGPVIVGAGPAGIATAACLKQRGIPSLILEKEQCVASSWKLKTYDRLRLHLPKQYCALPLLPFPPEFPAYPTKQQFICYLETYIEHFAINPLFGAEVKQAEYDSRIGVWRACAGEFEFVSRWLVVATGENAEAVWPEIDGSAEFKGRAMHTSCYVRGDEHKGERVLVVGCGNSGMEVALDLCDNDAEVSIVVRDKLHILPREILGISTFGLSMFLLKWLPVKLADALLLFFTWFILGDTEKYGIKRPEMGPLQLKNTTGKTPVLDIGTFAKIKTGQIKVVPEVNKFTSSGAEFVDGTHGQFHSIIFATGYKSNVASWLKEEEMFSKKDGFPRRRYPHSWRGKNGLYATGFTRRGLLGASMDACNIADDIGKQWNKIKHSPLSL